MSQDPYQYYQSPREPGQGPSKADYQQVAKGKTFGPGIGLMVTGGMALAYTVFNIYLILTMGVENLGNVPTDPTERQAFMVGAYGANIMMLVSSVLIVIGGIQLMTLKTYMFALITTILAMLPCTCFCFVFTLPFGIWGIIVLQDPIVKAAFD